MGITAVPETRNFSIASLACGAIGGGIAYITAFAATMSLVPRSAEGIRQVVDLPWPVFAVLPTAIALVTILLLAFVLGLVLRGWRGRVWFLLSSGLMLALATSFGVELLRRDFIGKL